MFNRVKVGGVMLALAAFAGAATAQTPAKEPPPTQPMGRLLACRAITDAGQRLACFDQETGAIAQRLSTRDLVVVDREAVRSTKRTLFGLTLPRIGLLDGDETNDVKELAGVVQAVGRNRDGGFVFFLEGGARWSQIDSRPIALEPQRGDKVTIRKAALGSYMLSVNRQPGVRVQRTQ